LSSSWWTERGTSWTCSCSRTLSGSWGTPCLWSSWLWPKRK